MVASTKNFYVASAVPFLEVAVSERFDSGQMQDYYAFVKKHSLDSFTQFRALRVAFETGFRPGVAVAYDKISWKLYLNLLKDTNQSLPERDTSLEFISSSRQAMNLSSKLEML